MAKSCSTFINTVFKNSYSKNTTKRINWAESLEKQNAKNDVISLREICTLATVLKLIAKKKKCKLQSKKPKCVINYIFQISTRLEFKYLYYVNDVFYSGLRASYLIFDAVHSSCKCVFCFSSTHARLNNKYIVCGNF